MITRILLKFFRPKMVKNFHTFCPRKKGQALLYFKTDPFVSKTVARRYSHTNNWEILAMAKILNELGFWVDILDRTITPAELKIQDNYDIFLGIGAGESGRYYADIAQKVPRAMKIFLAAGPEPDWSNELIKKRYDYFFQRHPQAQVAFRRTIVNVDIEKAMSLTDAIFAWGNEFSIATYQQRFSKPIFRLYPSSAPSLRADFYQLTQRSPKKFLYFGGHGNIVKGLDVVIEAFLTLSDLELYICAPKTEADFNKVYKEILAKSSNIHFVGFIQVGGDIFNQLTSECGFVVLPSCSEGTATSVTTCMRRALIPIVTFESGIDLEDFGYLIKDIDPKVLADQIRQASQIPPAEFIQKSVKTYINSFRYTQSGFSQSFEKALLEVLVEKGF